MTLDLNTSPYYDDFDAAKKYLEILFRPGYAVQARELTQIQSLLQNQIANLGSFSFNDGDVVIPGSIAVDTHYPYVKLAGGATLANFQSKKIVGLTSGTVATVLQTTDINGSNPQTFYVKIASGASVTPAFAATIIGTTITTDPITVGLLSVGSVLTTMTGVPAGTFVTAILSDTKVQLNQAITATTGITAFSGAAFIANETISTVETNYNDTGNISSTSSTITNLTTDATNLAVGNSVTGAGIVYGTVISSIVDKTTIIISTIPQNTTTGVTLTFSSGTASTTTVAASAPTGFGSNAQIQAGIYFMKGYFAIVDAQTIILDAYGSTPSYKVGLTFSDSVVSAGSLTNTSANTDITLNDPAAGSPNFNAPGADRYKAELLLTKIALVYDSNGVLINNTGADFYELVRVKNGGLVPLVGLTAPTQLTQILARRTYDNSGDYTVRFFPLHIDAVTDSHGNTIGFNADIEPGKAYVKGFEIETFGTTTLPITPAREFQTVTNANVPFFLGNSVQVQNLRGNFNITTPAAKTLYNNAGTSIGTAKVRGQEWYSGYPGASDGQYTLYLYDISMTGSHLFSEAVCIGSTFAASGTTAPSALMVGRNYAIVTMTIAAPGVVTWTGHGLSTGSPVVFETNGALPTGLTAGTTYYAIFIDANTFNVATSAANAFAGTKITTSGSQSGVHIASNGITFVNAGLMGADQDIEIVDTGAGVVRDLSSVAYSVRRVLTTGSALTGSPLKYISSAVSGDEVFASTEGSASTYNLTVAITNAGSQSITNPHTGNTYAVGDIIDFTNATNIGHGFAANNPAGSTTITLNLPNMTGVSVSVIATVNKQSASARTKVLTQATEILVPDSFGTITLSNTDVKNISSFMDHGDTNGAVDMRSRYSFDNGQRDNYFVSPTLTLKSGYPLPVGHIEITYTYWAPNSGDFFAVNSYGSFDTAEVWSGNHAAGVTPAEYGDIGFYYSSSGPMYDLISCIDFRSSEIPVPNSSIELTYDAFLGRQDILVLNPTGNFQIINGVSSFSPTLPVAPPLALTLYNISVAPYTFNVNDITQTMIDNRRYTMRDIGKLETRISNLEYYTTLSLLETSTSTLFVDDGNGNNMFKNGFVVDNFKTWEVSDVGNADFMASMDQTVGILRPEFHTDNIGLLENTAGLTDSASPGVDGVTNLQGYTKTGTLITLPYTQTPLITQLSASTQENINPYAVFSWVGAMTLAPSSDDWYDTTYSPDYIISQTTPLDPILAAQAGITTWNNWTTSWVGTPTVTPVASSSTATGAIVNGIVKAIGRTPDSFTASGDAGENDWDGDETATVTFTDIVSTQTGQTRTGLQTNIVNTVNNQLVGTVLVNQTVVPYIRQNAVLFTAVAMKPNTRVYPFFDSTSVAAFCSTYYSDTATLSTSSTTVTGLTVSATANIAVDGHGIPLVDTPFISDGNVPADTLVAQVLSSSSVVLNRLPLVAASGVSVSIANKLGTSTFATDAAGSVSGVFLIPDTSTEQFRTGQRVLTLIDSVTNDAPNSTTAALATYTASGTLNTDQNTILSTSVPSLVTTTVTGTQVLVTSQTQQTTETINSSNGAITNKTVSYVDPLAESFLISNPGGVFLSKIDIYFFTKDTSNIPVQLQIRNMENGLPGPMIVPFSTVTLTPDLVTTSADGSAATSFVFSSPVYLKDATEYCFVLLANSTQYRVWVSKLGQNDSLTGNIIAQQPYTGVLFKSQNASTWSPDQTEDIKFNIWRCVFNTSATGIVTFYNDVVPARILASNALSVSEIDTTTTIISVNHPNHGLLTGQKTTINIPAGTYEGISSTLINGQHIVTTIDQDNYTFTVAALATAVGKIVVSGGNLTATNNIDADLVNLNISNLTFANTTLGFSLLNTPVGSTTLNSSSTPVIVGQNVYFDSPVVVLSPDQQPVPDSFEVVATMTTSSNSVSPVIDTTRNSAIVVGNRITSSDAGENVVSGGSASAKYVTKPVTLASSATSIQVNMSMIRPQQADVEVYIKTLPSASNGILADETWTLVPATDYPTFDPVVQKDYTFALGTGGTTPMTPFSNFALKVVMLSTDTSEVPQIYNLRAIALS